MPECCAGVFDREPRLVGELAEVHLPRVRRAAQHEDVRAGAEDALLEAGDDDGVDLGVLEADALDRVGELDVDAEVVGVQLEPVVGREAGVLLDVHRQRRDRAVEASASSGDSDRVRFRRRRRSATSRYPSGQAYAALGPADELSQSARALDTSDYTGGKSSRSSGRWSIPAGANASRKPSRWTK